MWKESTFNRIVLGAVAGIVCDPHLDANVVDQRLKVLFEDMRSRRITASTVAQPQDRRGMGIALLADAVPIPFKTVTSKETCIATQANIDVSAIANQVVNPVRNDDSVGPTGEIMVECLERLRRPCTSCSIQHTETFFGLGIDRENGIPGVDVLARDFRDVLELMNERGLQMTPDEPDPYVNQLIQVCRHGREKRLLDRLLVASVIETRGAERFRIIAEALEDPELKAFYRDLWATEARHGDVFKKMALNYFDEDEIEARNQEIIDAEAEIIANLEWRPSLH